MENPKRQKRAAVSQPRVVFSISEIMLLTELCSQKLDIIECKDNSGYTSADKKRAFIEITAQFNGTPGVYRRKVEQIRNWYKNHKSKTKDSSTNQHLKNVTGKCEEQISLPTRLQLRFLEFRAITPPLTPPFDSDAIVIKRESVSPSPSIAYDESGYVYADGPGLSHGTVGQSANFTIHIERPDDGCLEVGMQGPVEPEVSTHDNVDGSVSINYTPYAAGEYKISIVSARNHIKGSPFSAEVTATYVEARNKLQQAEDTSDLQSEAVLPKRRAKRPKRFDNSSDEEESRSLLPPAPRILKKINVYKQLPGMVYESSPHTPLQTRQQTQSYTDTSTHSNTDTSTHSNTDTSTHSNTDTSTHSNTNTPTHSPFHFSTPLVTVSASLTNFLEQPTLPIQHHCSCNSIQLGILKDIQKQVQSLTNFMHTHLKKAPHTTHKENISLPSNIPVTLPIASTTDFTKLEAFLQDESNFSDMLSYFSVIGGNSVKTVVHRNLEAMISHNVAKVCNWKGRYGKFPFEKFSRIHGLVYQATLPYADSEKVSISTVEDIIKKWFQFANDRNGGRKARRNLL